MTAPDSTDRILDLSAYITADKAFGPFPVYYHSLGFYRCFSCDYAVHDISRHIRRKPHTGLYSKQLHMLDSMKAVYPENDLTHLIDAATLDSPHSPHIHGCRIEPNGYACLVCDYYIPKKNSLFVHFQKFHDSTPLVFGINYKEKVYLQSLFSRTCDKWFPSTPPTTALVPASSDQLLALLIAQTNEFIEDDIATPANAEGRTPYQRLGDQTAGLESSRMVIRTQRGEENTHKVRKSDQGGNVKMGKGKRKLSVESMDELLGLKPADKHRRIGGNAQAGPSASSPSIVSAALSRANSGPGPASNSIATQLPSDSFHIPRYRSPPGQVDSTPHILQSSSEPTSSSTLAPVSVRAQNGIEIFPLGDTVTPHHTSDGLAAGSLPPSPRSVTHHQDPPWRDILARLERTERELSDLRQAEKTRKAVEAGGVTRLATSKGATVELSGAGGMEEGRGDAGRVFTTLEKSLRDERLLGIPRETPSFVGLEVSSHHGDAVSRVGSLEMGGGRRSGCKGAHVIVQRRVRKVYPGGEVGEWQVLDERTMEEDEATALDMAAEGTLDGTPPIQLPVTSASDIGQQILRTDEQHFSATILPSSLANDPTSLSPASTILTGALTAKIASAHEDVISEPLNDVGYIAFQAWMAAQDEFPSEPEEELER